MSTIPHYLLTVTVNKQASPGEWKFVLQAADGSATFTAADAEPLLTAQRLELLSVVRGLEALEQPSRVTLVNPTRYLRRGLDQGLTQWRSQGWLWDAFGRRVPVKDCDLWQRLDRAMRIHRVNHRHWRIDHPQPRCPLPAPSPANEQAPKAMAVPVLMPAETEAACRRVRQPVRWGLRWRRWLVSSERWLERQANRVLGLPRKHTPSQTWRPAPHNGRRAIWPATPVAGT